VCGFTLIISMLLLSYGARKKKRERSSISLSFKLEYNKTENQIYNHNWR